MTMRHDDSKPFFSKPFDLEAREAADITQQFWGTSRRWDPPADVEPSDDMWADRTPRSIQALKLGLTGMRPRRPQRQANRSEATGAIDRTRSHGIVRPEQPADDLDITRREASLAELAAGWLDDDDWSEFDLPRTEPTRRVERDRDDAPTARAHRVEPDRGRPVEFDEVDFDEDELVPLSPVAPLAAKLGLGAVDPLLARLGAIVVIGVLLLPLALSARGGGDQPALATAAVSVAAQVAGLPSSASTMAATTAATATTSGVASSVAAAPTASATNAATATSGQLAATSAAEAAVSTEAPSSVAAHPTSEPAGDVPQSVSVATTDPVEVATVSETATRLEPECSLKYEAGLGDSWYRIADAAGISPKSLIDTNLAGLDTPIYPGDEICLPDGATMPSQPTTTTAAPTTTTAPATTAPPTTVKATTTTVKATTTTSPPPAPVSTTQVQALIREIWPDDLEERALQIAYRESNYKATAYNGGCCYGVFQINWSSHKSWLGAYGITSTNDLLDARKNITAAYALYQRSGGWGPWGG